MPPRFWALAFCFATACASPPPPAPATPQSELEARTAAAVAEVSSYLKQRLALSPPQEEQARAAAARLLERNARLVESARSGKARILESLRQSHARFDAEIVAILPPDQASRYFQLKRSLQQQTALGRAPFAPPSSRLPPRSASPPVTP
ncbi:MAG: hypothetical protein ABR576_04320 [Thermoanaerobaculia bacterium]